MRKKSLTIRLSEEERERLEIAAEHAGISLSEYIRRCAFGRVIIARTDEMMIRELRRLGGLLKHLWAQQGGRHPETLAVLQSIKATIEALAKQHNTP